MNPKIEKELHNAIDNRVVSWVFIEYLKKCEREIRAKIINRIIILICGSMFTFNILNFIFRKEIAELIDNVESITKKSILAFIDKIKEFKHKKKSNKK